MAELAFQRLHKSKERERRLAAAQQHEPPQPAHATELIEQVTRAPDAGDPLSPALRADLEAKFGRDLGDVRVHTSPDVARATAAHGALALTRGAHIYLAAPATAENRQVMAHELTHVVQQDAAPPIRFAATPQMTSAAPTPVPHAVAAPAAAQAAPAAAAPAQAFDIWGAARSAGGAISSGIHTAASAVVDVGEDLLSMGRDALMAVVRRVAPDFLPMFEGDGVASFLRNLIERGLHSLFEGLTAPLRGLVDVDALMRHVQSATEWASQIGDQLAHNSCTGLLQAARTIGRVVSDALKPMVDLVKGAAEKVQGFFHDIWESIGLPIMDILRKIGGAIWDSLKDFVGDLASLIRTVRDALGSAWHKVKGWLGIPSEDGPGEGGGLWSWVRDKASSIGSAISDVIRPALGPLRTVGEIMLLIIPGGQLPLIMLHWSEIKQAYDQMAHEWEDLNLIPRARAQLANVIIPRLLNGAEQFGQAVIAGADWLLARLDEFHQALGRVAEVALGVLSPMRALVEIALDVSHRLITWARDKLRYLSQHLHEIMNQVIAFMGKVLAALRDLIAAVVNPFGIIGFLAGHIWLALPECLKGPIIDFLLDVLDRFVRALPDSPLLGLLWPVVKAALIGFVAKVKSVELEEKIKMADKIAKIISGQSFDFAIGYLKGILLGIWEAIIGPFQALAAIFELPDRIQRFLENMGVSFCELVERIRCFLATLAGSVFGRLDDLLGTLQEYLSHPEKILDLIKCAIEGVLSAAEHLGATLAERMIAIFRESDEQIGERLGRITGSLIVQAVIAYFTAGMSAGVGIAGKIAEMLGAVGGAMTEVLQFITQQLGRLINFIKGVIARIGRAIVDGAKAIFGKMKAFFAKVFAWLEKLFGKFFARIRKMFMMTAAELALWEEFKTVLHAQLLEHPSGITRRELRTLFRGTLQRFKSVAKWPAYITKHGPNWRLHVRPVKSILPHSVGDVPLDPTTCLRAGTREAKRQIRLLKATHENIGLDDVESTLERVRLRYHMTTLSAHYEPQRQSFKVHGAVNPVLNWSIPPNRPTHNVEASSTAHRSIVVDPLTKADFYSPPTLAPWSPWDEVGVIRAAPSGTSSLYVRGHIAHGRFIDGKASNLMPITRSANALMRSLVEGRVIEELSLPHSKRPVFRYEVTTADPTLGTLIPRRIPKAGGGSVCQVIPQEGVLVSSIRMVATPYTYNISSKKWDQPAGPAISSGPITNVPHYPAGHGEPCP